MDPSDAMSRAPHFRAGAGAVILSRDGRVLVFERADIPGAWQFPQGGLEPGESPEDAVWREVREETGLERPAIALLARYPEPLVYELPPAARRRRTGLGQVQYWFFFRAQDAELPVRLEQGGEFRGVRWAAFPDVIAATVEFRRGVYARLFTFAQDQRLL